MMKKTEEIFSILSKGMFISRNSTSQNMRAYYDLLEDHQQEYADYYAGIGFLLEGGNGYFYFCRKESKADMQRKLERMAQWIDILDFLKTYNGTFSSGFEFMTSDIEVRLSSDIELKEKAEQLFRGRHSTHQEIIERLMKELTDNGFAELISEVTKQYVITDAFHYMEELVDCLTISDEVKNEIPE